MNDPILESLRSRKKRINEASGDEKYIEFMESVPLEPLNAKLTELLGTPVNLELQPSRKARYPELRDDTNLVSKTGVLQASLESLTVETFNSQIEESGDILYYWCTIHFEYKAKSGGMNGLPILRAMYNRNGSSEWEFK